MAYADGMRGGLLLHTGPDAAGRVLTDLSSSIGPPRIVGAVLVARVAARRAAPSGSRRMALPADHDHPPGTTIPTNLT